MSKKKRGRPHADNPANKALPTIRVTPGQLNAYQRAAETKDQPFSAWVRTQLDKAAKRDLNE